MKQFWTGCGIGFLACLLIIIVGLTSLALYYHIGPGNIFVFNDENLQSIYVIRAPEQRSETQAQNLMEAHLMVLNMALDLPTEMERVGALGYWAQVLMCGMSPMDPACRVGEMPVMPLPQGGKPL